LSVASIPIYKDAMNLSDISPGILVDEQLAALCTNGELITGDFEPKNIKQACYELRASNIFYETSALREDKRVTADSSGYILRPSSHVTVIVLETIELPENVLARILAKGQLFSIGIVPVNTYADPGFVGRLGITLFNASHRHLVIEPGQAIVKIEFVKLNSPVLKPYKGQHGYETKIWPIPTQFYAGKELLNKQKVDPSSLEEIEASYGPVVRSLEGRLRSYERKIWVQISITVVSFVVIFIVARKVDWAVSIGLGVVSSVLTNLFAFGYKSLFRK
jgi:dCTP deaminase